MSSLYEHWKPAIGDRVRIVERNETGAAVQTGQTGTVVAVHPDAPERLCEVAYDPRPGGRTQPYRHHQAGDLEPIEATAERVRRIHGQQPEPAAGGDADWQPTVGDWVAVAASGRRGVITAVDRRAAGTVCEVEYDHRPGQQAEPRRASHAQSDLLPTREPSAEAVEG